MLEHHNSPTRFSLPCSTISRKTSAKLLATLCTVFLLNACNSNENTTLVESTAQATSTTSTNLVFAPHQGLVAPVEKPFRDEVSLNGSWQFQAVAIPDTWVKDKGQAPELTPAQADKWDATTIRIPSPWNVNGFQQSNGQGPDYRSFPSYPESWDDVKMAWMKRSFTVPENWDGKRINVHFEAVAGDTIVLINGKEVAHNFDAFLPFSADVTDHVTLNGENEILVGVRAPKLFEDRTSKAGRRTWPGGSFWGSYVAGIWQDVSLQAHSPVYVSDVFVKPLVDQDTLEIDVTISNQTAQDVALDLSAEISPWLHSYGSGMLKAPVESWQLGDVALEIDATQTRVTANQSATVTLRTSVDNALKLWNAATPNLYGVEIALNQDDAQIDNKYQRFGWRQWSMQGQDYFLNGEKVVFKGDSWHFTGIPMMTRRYAWSWYSAIKDANGNAVRPHAQVYPRFYLDMADEMGIYVLHENSIWASDGGHKFDSELFWERSADHTERWVMRDRNHASVFGWSISNENWPIIEFQLRDQDLMARQNKEWHRWANIVNTLDGTRPWISADGDKEAAGAATVLINHYGNEANMQELSSKGMPWGIGEQGMGYYGSPAQVSSVNGDRAFESSLGRMEGIAYEAYRLIELNEKYNAAYSSVFNLAWYALKPLPFGHENTSIKPNTESGIYFTHFEENRFGVQPEKIGAYSSTFNPGYDASLPLYETWPLFDAIKAANGNNPEEQKRWETYPEHADARFLPSPASAPAKLLSANLVAFEGVATEAGLAVDMQSNDKLIIDGANPPLNAQEVKTQISTILDNGGSVLVYNPTPDAAADLNAFLPASLNVTPSDSCSWVIEDATYASNNLTNADLYFCEVQSTSVMRFGLSGELVEQGNVLWRKAETDWRMWNKRPEASKTATLLRSELEREGPDAALVEYKGKAGSLFVLSTYKLDYSTTGQNLLEKLFVNTGFKLNESRDPAKAKAFNPELQLTNVLALGTFDTSSSIDEADDTVLQSPVPTIYAETSDKRWLPYRSNADGVFNFKPTSLSGPQNNASVYLSYSIYSPRSLDNVLEEPDMPQLDLIYGSDDGHKIWLNGELLVNHETRHGAHSPDAYALPALPLKAGWNNILVKVTQGGGDWKFSAKLQSNSQDYLSKIDSAISRAAN